MGLSIENVFAGREVRSNLLKKEPYWYLGIDLGQAQDYTAFVLLQRVELVNPERDRVTMMFPTETQFYVRLVQRVPLGSPYPEVVARVKKLLSDEAMRRHCKVIVDATGVGRPVVELLQRGGLGCDVVPVTITSGDLESNGTGGYRVPKKDLMAGLQVAFQKRRLSIADGAGAVEELVDELRSMRVRMNAEGHETFSGRPKDDLVLALALAWWKASREIGW